MAMALMITNNSQITFNGSTFERTKTKLATATTKGPGPFFVPTNQNSDGTTNVASTQ